MSDDLFFYKLENKNIETKNIMNLVEILNKDIENYAYNINNNDILTPKKNEIIFKNLSINLLELFLLKNINKN